MSDLDDAMEERMAYIVFIEHRPFSYIDFHDLMKPKTYRNKISKLKKDGKVKLCYKSVCAFHTLQGHNFGKPVTPNHTEVTISHNDPVNQMFKNLPKDNQSIHDIRSRFTAHNIYETFSNNTPFPKDDVNKDIRLPYWNINNAIVQIRIHKTDTVSVIIACSRETFSLDHSGIIAFFTILARIQGLLAGIMLTNYHKEINQNESIPDYTKWIITMWHFGRDGLLEYTGEKFSITIEKTQHTLHRIYSKNFGKQSRIRDETQECLNKTVSDAIEEKLNSIT
jgi:hypothetical protein